MLFAREHQRRRPRLLLEMSQLCMLQPMASCRAGMRFLSVDGDRACSSTHLLCCEIGSGFATAASQRQVLAHVTAYAAAFLYVASDAVRCSSRAAVPPAHRSLAPGSKRTHTDTATRQGLSVEVYSNVHTWCTDWNS